MNLGDSLHGVVVSTCYDPRDLWVDLKREGSMLRERAQALE